MAPFIGLVRENATLQHQRLHARCNQQRRANNEAIYQNDAIFLRRLQKRPHHGGNFKAAQCSQRIQRLRGLRIGCQSARQNGRFALYTRIIQTRARARA